MPEITIRIPSALRSKARGCAEISAQGETIAEVLECLRSSHEELAVAILTEDGKVRRFVNLFLGERNVNTLSGLKTPVRGGDVLLLVQAIVGG